MPRPRFVPRASAFAACAFALTAALSAGARAQFMHTLYFHPVDDITVSSQSPQSGFDGPVMSVKDGGLRETVSIYPRKDAFVRGGSHATSNFGTASTMMSKRSDNLEFARESYLGFNLSAVAGAFIDDADLMAYCKRVDQSGASNPSPVILVNTLFTNGESWSETGLTWNNRYTWGWNSATRTVTSNAYAWQRFSGTELNVRTRANQPDDMALRMIVDNVTLDHVECHTREASGTGTDPHLSAAVDWGRHPDGSFNPAPPQAKSDHVRSFLKFDLSSIATYRDSFGDDDAGTARLVFSGGAALSSEPNGRIDVWGRSATNAWSEESASWPLLVGTDPNPIKLVDIDGITTAARFYIPAIPMSSSGNTWFETQMADHPDGVTFMLAHETDASNQTVLVQSSESDLRPYLEVRIEMCPYTLSHHSGALRYCARDIGGNRAVDTPGADIERAVIVIHGSGRDANRFLDVVWNDADAFGVDDTTMVIAPLFNQEGDFRLGDTFYWSGNWRWAGLDIEFGEVTSYELIDELIEELLEHQPNLTDVTVVGHSAGGQLVTRYAAATTMPEVAAFKQVDIKFIVSAAGTFMYPTEERSVPTTECPTFDHFRFGLVDHESNPYMGARTKDELRTALFERNIEYIVGEHDDQPGDEDWQEENCEETVQGLDRKSRMQDFTAHTQQACRDSGRSAAQCAHIETTVVADCDHTPNCLFNNTTVRRLMFTDSNN